MIKPQTLPLVIYFVFSAFVCFGQNEWPKEIDLSSGGKVIIYQPQPERLEGNLLTSRAAVSVRINQGDEPVFGAVWAETNLLTDLDTRMATLEDVRITDVRFPDVTNDEETMKFRSLLESEIPKWNLELSIDNIIATLEEGGEKVASDLKNSPPKIIYSEKPATLVLVEGAPKLEKVEDAGVERVVNTPFLILRNPDDRLYYLYGGDIWYSSRSIETGWMPAGTLDKKMSTIDQAVKEQQEKEEQEPREVPSDPPAIIVSTEPAELIQSDGAPDFKSIEGTSLLYMSNTQDHIFMDISSQKYFVILAGRWYTAASLEGTWEYVAADALPADFQKIPSGSDKDVVLANVAGTQEAKEARLDAQIPQTAKVDINSTDCTVEYDGKPQFEAIEGTSLEVATNTSSTVLKAGGSYYAVENGVWFKSKKPDGPWKVSTERPQEVEKIPASSPAYNTRYVYIYDVTPQYVYMGYTPGYLGSYVYGPTVVYGTGYYYPGWYGAYYYPRPVTWGFGMSYNPWTGWSMGFGFSNGFFSFSWGWGGGYYHGGWWGPPVYRPPYRPVYRGGYYGPSRRNVYNNNRVTINNNVNINVDRSNNLYNRRSDVVTRDRGAGDRMARPGNDRTATTRDRRATTRETVPSTRDRSTGNDLRNQADRRPQAKPATREKNNVYTDKSGNVYKQKQNGNWQQRTPSGWENNTSRQRELNSQSYQRSRGQTRTSNYQRSMPARPSRGTAPRRRGQ